MIGLGWNQIRKALDGLESAGTSTICLNMNLR